MVDRRQSTFASSRRMSVVGGNRRFSVLSSSVGATDKDSKSKPEFRLENTYRTEPDRKFPALQVKNHLDQYLARRFQSLQYNPVKMAAMSKTVADEIKEEVKQILQVGKSPKSPAFRYKLVSYVTIGNVAQQGMCVTSRALWHPQFDDFVESKFVHNDLYVVAVVYAVYFE